MGSWSEFRYEPLAKEYDVGICASHEGCKRGYSANRHLHGYADNLGTVHWQRWHSSPTRKRGLHKLLTLIAVIKLQHHRRKNLPLWKARHETEVWAQQQAKDRFRLRFPLSYSRKARLEAWEDMQRHHVPTRSMDMTAYMWMYAAKLSQRKKENTQ